MSDTGDIDRFQPRPPEGGGDPVVWAIDAQRLRNYLVPRDCPRVTYYAGPATTAEDRDRFLGASVAVIGIESNWYERVRLCRLYCYHMPHETFECIDDGAGYFVSRQPVTAESVEVVEDAIAALLRRGVELRIIPNLWPLHDAVVQSSLMFSMIRMRHALPRVVA